MSSLDDSELARLEKKLLDDVTGATDRCGGRLSSWQEEEETFLFELVEDPSEQDFLHNARAEELKKKYNPESPLASRPIPKKIDFVGAAKEAPEIARMEYTPPVLDEALPRKSFRWVFEDYGNLKRVICSYRIQVDEASLFADAEVLLNALNLMAIARSEPLAGCHPRADLCIVQAMEVLSFGIEANLTRRRERFLRSFGVEPLKMVHNLDRFPVRNQAAKLIFHGMKCAQR
ncbi:unnamed protein product [Heligmosomoides polygyrus]|uniref:RPAP3_C domain-containing protein n=1 Tax=Heligmosomoides polygyrus TaxID=6339 RepID=A0A183FYY2_HELPZ|nr:unnamed protein product [Heligmosomoides polygyrus]